MTAIVGFLMAVLTMLHAHPLGEQAAPISVSRGEVMPRSLQFSTRVTSPPVAAGGLQHALVSWYARGERTASGARFDPDGATFAHLSMPFGTLIRFCRGDRCVVARCTDRGPAAWTGRLFDLSRGAFAAIAPLSVGVAEVTWEVVG